MDYTQIFRLQNPHREGKSTARLLWKRRLEDVVYNSLNHEKITILYGARQSGKSTLARMIIDRLINDGTSPSDIYYFSMDTLEYQELFAYPSDLLEFIQKQGGDLPTGRKIYLVLDEAQKIREVGLYLKNLADLDLPLAILATGSSSLLLRARTKEHMTGRKREFTLTPLTFSEITKNKNAPPEEIKNLFEDYLIYGGYPSVVLGQDKQGELLKIHQDYMQKDVTDFLKIADPLAFNKLVSALAFQAANLVNRQELGTLTEISRPTVLKYLQTLRDTFVLSFLSPFFTNKRKSLSKREKVYFWDLGLRNFCGGGFAPVVHRGDIGALAENAAFLELNERLLPGEKLYYWQTKSGAEVDFILEKGGKIIPIEVKWLKFTRPEISQSFESFIDEFSPDTGFILTAGFTGETVCNKTQIKFLSVWELTTTP
jgi:hypothetical protein